MRGNIRKRVGALALAGMMMLGLCPAALAQENSPAPLDETGYAVTFVSDGRAAVDVYYTKDYAAADETEVTIAYARNSDTGEIDVTGNGQVNFKVRTEEGYEIADVAADRNFKNLKGAEDTGVEGIYRLTKVTGPVTVTITTCAVGSGEPSEPVYTPVEASDTRVAGFYNDAAALKLELAGRYNSGAMSEDGGSLEIVQYNSLNGFAYAVSGVKGKLIAVDLNSRMAGTKVTALTGAEYDVKSMVAVDGFVYGDMTSVAISPDGTKLAAVIQAENQAAGGIAAVFACKDDGSLDLLATVAVGVQPDMVTFADNNTILTADEGEPREGVDGVDPKGSVTVVTIGADNALTAEIVYFDPFDAQRDALTASGVLVQKGIQPSTDFEPEYIAVSGSRAYVALQEANAVAVLDIPSRTFTAVYPLGFQNYGQTQVDLLKNDAIGLNTYENIYGIRMPDGISVTTIGGKDYLLTPNEGDSRSDWPGMDNEYENKTSPTGNVTMDKKVVWFNAALWDGLEEGKDYIFGGRSFTVYEVRENGLELVYDSGSDFEEITAAQIPDHFNASNNKLDMDNRSGKKGPEPETVVTGTVNGRVYAFVGLERIGGVMVYDITDPANAACVNYINSREFEAAVQGDVSPEGLCFIPAAHSKTGKALLLTACEVSGTLAVYEVTGVADNTSGGNSGSTSGSSRYSVNIQQGAGGMVSADPRRASAGKVVTLTVSPDQGYHLVSLNVSDKMGGTVPLKEMDGQYTFTMPAGAVTAAAIFAADSSARNPFVDVTDDAYYRDAVLWAAEKGITGGINTGRFGPHMMCTRAQAVTCLWRAAGSPMVNSGIRFTDVPEDAYYGPAVRWAVSMGITAGISESTFGPDAVCTRAQIITFLWCAKNSPVTGTADFFADVASDAYYHSAVLWAFENGVTAGTSASAFSPSQTCTRAEIITFLYRCMK